MQHFREIVHLKNLFRWLLRDLAVYFVNVIKNEKARGI